MIITERYNEYSSAGEIRLVCKCDNIILAYHTNPLNLQFRGDEAIYASGIRISHCESRPWHLIVDVFPDAVDRLPELLLMLQRLDEERTYHSTNERAPGFHERVYDIVHQFNAARPMPYEVD